MATNGERKGGRGKIGAGDKKYNKLLGIHKLQGYILQDKEYSQYFIITIHGV